jgi:hypothetical protein
MKLMSLNFLVLRVFDLYHCRVTFPARKLALLLFSTVIFALASASAQSAVLTVTNTNDSGTGSLRDTIAAATNGDTIQFDAALNGQAITLTSAQILIDKNLTINGPGANQLTVQRSTANGTPAFRIIDISLDNFSGGSVTLTGLTLANGNASQGGGGVSFSGTVLTIANCVFSGNSAAYGGGIYGAYGLGQPMVNITNSVISGNRAEYGGAIYIDYYAGSYFSGPTRLAMTNSTISGNVATSLGGGLYNRGSSVITNSTISANVATMDEAGGGGGIYNEGSLSIANSTISGNSASLGGGIKNVQTHYFFYPGRSNVTSSTLSNNSASEGGGIYSFSFATQRSRSSIIARNSSANGPDMKGDLTSDGFNVIGNNSGATISPAQDSDQIGTPASPVDPLLGPLQDNGGPTFTHALLLGSPAIDKGESSGSATDQRGARRPVDITEIANAPGGDGADIGAFESALPTLANISTRALIQTGDNAMIGGFIITGTGPKTVIVRGIGPSLAVPGALADPIIEVHGPSGEFLGANDNWRDALTRQQINDSGLAPANDLESALWGTINPGAYTVIVRGKNDATGIALFEVYDLDQTADSRLGNVSTRGFVGIGDNVMIGGTIVAGNTTGRVLFRAIGPSLTNFGIPNALGDPILELYDGNGGLVADNHDWRDDQEAEIINTGLAPSNDLEAAIVRDLAPGTYTAIVRGKNDATGLAVVEVYNLN